MKKLLIKLFLLNLLTIYSYITVAQNNYVDSLKKVLLTYREDTNRVNTLRKLDLYFSDKKDSLNVINFANEALSLSKKLNYKKGIGNAYKDIGYFYLDRVNNYPLALKYFINSFDIKKQANDRLDIAGAYYDLAACYRKLNDYQNAFINVNEALSRYLELNNFSFIADTYTMIGLMYAEEGNYPEEIKNYYAALKIYEKLGDKKNIGNTLQYIGAGYDFQGNYTDALTNLEASLNVRKEIGDKSSIAQTLITIGDIYIIDSNYSEAINYHLQGLQLFKDAGKEAPDWGLPFAYRSLGSDYEIKANTAFGSDDKKSGKDFSLQAVQYYLLALMEYRKSSVLEGVPATNMSLGNLYLKLGNTIKAKYYLQESIDEFERINTLPALQSAYSLLPYLDSINGNFRKALEDQKKLMTYTFRIYNKESNKKIMHSQMQYEFDKKSALTRAEQDKKDAEAKRIKNEQYFIIAALGLIVLAVLTIALIQFRNNKQKRKANLLLQDEKQKVESTLSELKSAQAQLIQSEKMASLGELTAGIAHEIQNPLNFVNNFSEVNTELIDELKEERKKEIRDFRNEDELLNNIKENEGKINHHGKRADAIVKGMLQHARVSSGQKEPTDINALADEYLRLSYQGLRARDKNFNATMHTEFDRTIGNINIVPQDIARVLLNLYNNAFYAVRPPAAPRGGEKNTVQIDYKPTVTVSTKSVKAPSGGLEVLISIKDNGNGIPQKIVDKIFQPFFTTKPTGQGTGLGLSLSYDIIKAHGGEIRVETKEGEGSEFIIMLPIV